MTISTYNIGTKLIPFWYYEERCYGRFQFVYDLLLHPSRILDVEFVGYKLQFSNGDMPPIAIYL